MSAQTIPLIYNPDLVHRDTLVRSFVVREDLLAAVLDDLRRTTSTRQHHVFVGQRGMGKSTLLHRIAYAIDDDAELAQRWVPLLFPEEQYNIRRLSDLLSNTVDALAERLEGLHRDDDAAALDRAVQAIAGDEEARQGQLLALLRRHAEEEHVRLVLLIDNLDMTLERIGATPQWRLREILQGEDWLVVVGAGTSMHESTWEYDRAFYDFFQVHELKGLDYEETRRLFGRLAEMHQANEVTRALEEAPAKIRALHRLTGGNPRTLSLLFNVLQRAALGDITDDLTALLDLSTPLYRHRLESLAPQQQRVVDALALHWAPMTAGELAAALGDGVNDVSSQLSRMVRDGVIETLDLPDTTKSGYQIAERFFNVWYLMRAGRRLRKQLDWLVHFLRDFYEATELEALVRAEVQRGREKEKSGGRVQMLMAYADALEGGAVCRAVQAEALAMASWLEQKEHAESLLEEYATDAYGYIYWVWALVGVLGHEPGDDLQRATIQHAIAGKTLSRSDWLHLLLDLARSEPRRSKAFVLDAIASVAADDDANTAAVRSITHAVARMFLEGADRTPEKVFEPVRLLVDCLRPANTMRIGVAMAVLVRLGWAPAVSVLRPYLVSISETAPSAPMSNMTDFARAAIEAGHTRPFRVLLDEVHLAARWRPLAEALDCIVARDTSHLLRLPAEIRAATQDLLAVLAPDLPAPVARKKRPRPRA